MNELEELENRINRCIAVNNLQLSDNRPELDAYELGFSFGLHFVLEVITELKAKKNESCNQTK